MIKNIWTKVELEATKNNDTTKRPREKLPRNKEPPAEESNPSVPASKTKNNKKQQKTQKHKQTCKAIKIINNLKIMFLKNITTKTNCNLF